MFETLFENSLILLKKKKINQFINQRETRLQRLKVGILFFLRSLIRKTANEIKISNPTRVACKKTMF